MRLKLTASLLMLVLFAFSAVAQDKAVPPTEETVNAFMQHMFGYDSSLTWKISEIKPSTVAALSEVTVLMSTPQGQQNAHFYVTADGQHALVGDMIPFGADPFAADRERLQKGLNGPARGPASSTVTIVEFSDLQCPHCKEGHPTLDQLLAAEPTAHFVFQNFPLPMHNWAMKGAAYVDCIGRASNDAVWKFIQKAYESQSDITEANADEKLTAIADASGAKGSEVAACAAKPETRARIDASLALGKSVGVNGTPTLFINGRKVGLGGAPLDYLKNLVEFAAKQGK
jgi:protein-disulfide isomerase